MSARKRLGIFSSILMLGLMLGVMDTRATATNGATNATTNAISEADGKAAEATLISNQEFLRSNLQIQEQLHNALLAIEKNRQESAAAASVAARNSELLDARIGLMEKMMHTQQVILEQSNKMFFIAAGTFAGVGFLVLLVAAFVQWTGVHRLAAVAAAMPSKQTAASLPEGESHLLATQVLEQANTRFLGVLERLEERVKAMELASPSQQRLLENGSAKGDGKAAVVHSGAQTAQPSGTDKAGAITLLLGKGQMLLKLDQPQAALECFDEVLALDPTHADALVKKGAALERLQRLDEAINCYDRAIARDNSMTMAYLYKGGVFNRMERYSEALECYEQALKSQQKGQAANVIMD